MPNIAPETKLPLAYPLAFPTQGPGSGGVTPPPPPGYLAFAADAARPFLASVGDQTLQAAAALDAALPYVASVSDQNLQAATAADAQRPNWAVTVSDAPGV